MVLNCADGLSYRHYSAIYDLGRKLADDEYSQGEADAIRKFAEWLHENYTVNDNHNDEVSAEDLLWEYSNK